MNYHCYCLSIPISPDYSASSECNHLILLIQNIKLEPSEWAEKDLCPNVPL